jgi:imidazolonepropionase-like amidohydrolase
MKRFVRGTLPAALLLCALPLRAQKQPGKLALTGLRIIPVSGPEIASGTILIENGVIKAVGASVAIPAGYTTLSMPGRVAVPGFVDANSRIGLGSTENEQYAEVTPNIQILNQYRPTGADVRRALQCGTTTACLTPGSANIIGGRCTVVKTAGESAGDAALRKDVAVRAALGEDTFSGNAGFRSAGANLTNIYLRRPNSKMAAVFELRYALAKATRYPILKSVIQGQTPLRVHARAANDIRAAVTIADEFSVRHLVIDDGVEAAQTAELLASHHVPVVLGPFSDPQTNAPERTSALFNTAGLLAKAGVKVAFGTGGGDETMLRTAAMMAVHGGMMPDLALKAITSAAAEVAGVADRVGTLVAGKDADILILNGEPLDPTAHIEKVLVNGRVVFSE